MTLINNFDGLLNADNASGAPWFQVVKPEDVASIPDVMLDQINTAITLNGGAVAFNIMATVGTVQWSETPQTVDGRLQYKSVFSFIIPKDRADVLNYAQHLNNRGVIAIVRDANGQSRLMGTVAEPATFRLATRTLGNQEGQRNEHLYEIVLTSPKPVPFYQVSSHLPAPANVCPPPPSLSINVYSDAGLTTPITSADYDQQIYIDVTASGIIPTEYVYSIDCVDETMVEVSASGTLAFTVGTFNDVTIYVQAKDATEAAAAFASFTLTINTDSHAAAFIAAHNTASGATMAALQQNTAKGFVRLLRGVGTPHESDLLTYYQGFPNARMWIQAPVSDAVVSADAYALDLIHLATGTYVNFVSGDFATTGVNSGTTKYFASGVSPSDFDQNSLYVGQYIREESSGTRLVCGSSQAASFNNSTFMQCTGDGSNYANVNGSGIITFGIAHVGKSLGLCGVNRPSSSFYELKYSDKVLLPKDLTSNTPSTNEMYFHAMNYGGSANFYFNKEVCMYMILPSMTHEQLDDLKYAVQWYNANIITGGRDV
jgi:hypothetical protein